MKNSQGVCNIIIIIHNLGSVLENETHALPWDLGMKTNHLILAGQPDLVRVKKKMYLPNSWLCCPSRLQSKIKRKWKER